MLGPMYPRRWFLPGVLLAFFLSTAPPSTASVNIVFQENRTVTTGRLTIFIPQSWLQTGHVYTITTMPVSGQTSSYGDPYIWSVMYKSGSSTRRVVYQSRHDNDSGELAHLRKEWWNAGEDKAEFWVQCEVSSCYMRVTVYERLAGTFDRKTFYREGVEPGVSDGQFSLYKDFYHPTEKNGDYGLQVLYETDRYIYLYRQDGFAPGSANALSLWVRSAGLIDEDDLWLALTTGNNQIITPWLPFSNYATLAQSQTWYRVVIPLTDLNPIGVSIVGLAIRSDRSGIVYFDDVAFTTEEVGLLWPLAGGFDSGSISTPFGADWSKSCGGLIKRHVGIDVPAPVGQEVRSAMTGVVKEIVSDPDFKQGVVVEDATGSFTVVYWHLNVLVSKGQTIQRGDLIGTIASMSPTPHLHFGYRRGGYVEVALRGALPQQDGCEGDPAFPEHFLDPATLSYGSW
jgi:murein DD-endopeptidase MepM/ murein hydrolase activator NlpD